MSWWPPYWGARIRVGYVARDFREVVVELRLSRWNRNAMGTHFGGSLYAMTDPFYVLMLQRNLPRGMRIWDKAAAIDFVAPGRGTVRARLVISDADLAQIEAATAAGDKHLHFFKTEIVDEAGLTVARVEKIVYLRRPAHSPAKETA